MACRTSSPGQNTAGGYGLVWLPCHPSTQRNRFRLSFEMERPEDRIAGVGIFRADRFAAGTGARLYPSACQPAGIVQGAADMDRNLLLHRGSRGTLLPRLGAE